LLQAGHSVRALVRDPRSERARAIAQTGAELVQGDLEDAESLAGAAFGVDAVFSVQVINPTDRAAEVRQALSLIAAAKANGVAHFVQSSVSGVGHPMAWRDERRDRAYWQSKAAIEDAVRAAGFTRATILRPAFMMENFIQPKARWMFPDLASGLLRTAISPDTRLALVAADDVGAATVATIERADGSSTLELAGDVLTMAEIAQTLSRAWKYPIRAETISPADAISAGQSPGWVLTQQWMNESGYPARPEDMIAAGLAPTRLAEWARKHRP
jgi:uncharacterized protein YbjT (DUF2867 family)